MTLKMEIKKISGNANINTILGVFGIVIGTFAILFSAYSSSKLLGQLDKVSESFSTSNNILLKIRDQMDRRTEASNWMGRIIYMKDDYIQQLTDKALDGGLAEISNASPYRLTKRGNDLLQGLEIRGSIDFKYDISQREKVESPEPEYFLLKFLSTRESIERLEEYNEKTKSEICLEELLGTIYIYAGEVRKRLYRNLKS